MIEAIPDQWVIVVAVVVPEGPVAWLLAARRR
jgi:hypothetical protein